MREPTDALRTSRWWKNGDHPDDFRDDRPYMENGQFCMKPGAFFREHDWEGGIVRYFRHPSVHGETVCLECQHTMHEHGWIDEGPDGQTVCPGDFIITHPDGTHVRVKGGIGDMRHE